MTLAYQIKISKISVGKYQDIDVMLLVLTLRSYFVIK